MSDIRGMDKTFRLNEIDLYRFAAAVSVVFFHYAFRGGVDGLSALPYPMLAQVAKYGFLGVDFFFMISGFVILMTTASGRLQSFLISRILRLYPAFWACCTITFLAIVLLGSPRFDAAVNQYAINMTMLSGFLDVPSIDGVYWSLFIECRFYFLIAIVLALKLNSKMEQLFGAWLLATVVLYFYPVNLIDKFLITNYSSCFIAGGALYLIWSKGISWYRALLVLSAFWLSTLKSIEILPEMEKKYLESFDPIVVASLVAAFYLAMLAVALRKTGRLGKLNWMWAGVITYPLYLLHQNIGYIVFNAAHRFINHHVLFWSVFFGMLLLSYAVHAYVERPFVPRFRVFLNALVSSFSGCWGRARLHYGTRSGS